MKTLLTRNEKNLAAIFKKDSAHCCYNHGAVTEIVFLAIEYGRKNNCSLDQFGILKAGKKIYEDNIKLYIQKKSKNKGI